MTSGACKKHRSSMRLTAEFRAGFDWKPPAFDRAAFETWARETRKPPLRFDFVHKWRAFRDGEPVAREVVEAFSEYISDELNLGRHPVSAIAAPCDPAEHEDGNHAHRLPNLWSVKGGWQTAMDYFRVLRDLSIPDEAYCRNESDIREATRIIVRNFGESHNKTLVGDEVIAFAERVSHRPLDQYAETLCRFWRANESAVLFATLVKDGAPVRVGVAACAAVTEEYYRRFRGGEHESLDITERDLLPQSLFIHIETVADNREYDFRWAKAARSAAIARTVVSQIASLSPPLNKSGADLRLIAATGAKESAERARTYGFQPVGARCRLSQMPIVEFAPPVPNAMGYYPPRELAAYWAMKLAVLVFQTHVRPQQGMIER